ncbi:MAG: flagellar export protein FliJ [Chromatiales bacterium]|jgi:flagellar FliJ protein
MSPSKRFNPVQRVAQSREQKAARHMGESHKHLLAEEAKLLQLKQYHDEYLTRFETAARKGLSSAQLQEYRAFLARLGQAISEQEQVVAARKREHGSKKDDWRESHTRTQALNKVVRHYRLQEQQSADRQEQKESDDRGQRGSKR